MSRVATGHRNLIHAITPADVVGCLAWFAPDQAATVTLADSGTTIDALTDPSPGITRSWTAPTTGRRHLWVPSGTGGLPAIRTTAARHSTLSNAVGGGVGNFSHTMFCAAEIDGLAVGGQIGSVLALGSQGATSQLAVWDLTYWGGGNGLAAPRINGVNVPGYPTGSAVGPGFPVDPTALHLWCKTYDADSGKITVYVDGQFLYGAQAYTPNLSAGTGIGVYDGSLTADAYIYQAAIFRGIPTDYSVGAQRQRKPGTGWWWIEEFFRRVCPPVERPTMITGTGDSMTKASNLAENLQAANNYLARMQGYLSTVYGKTVRWINWGNPGSTSSAIVALLPSQSEACHTKLSPKRINSAYVGTNNLLNLASGASQGAIDTCVNQIIADYQTIIARGVTYGDLDATMIFTLHQCSTYVGNSRETARLQANTAIRALASSVAPVVLVADMGNTAWAQAPGNTTVYAGGADTTHFAAGVGGGYDLMGSLGADTCHALC